MVRDFTDATKERLLRQVDDINKKNWNWFTDALGDAVLYVGKWTKILSINDDMSNIQAYQRKVLDMNNTTQKELKKIFEDVYSIDLDYSKSFSKLDERQLLYNSKLKQLSNMIKSNFTLPNAESIKSQLSDINNKLINVDSKINKEYEAEMDYAAKEAAKEAAKSFFGGIVSTVVDVLTLPVKMVKNVATGNYGGIVSDVYSLIGDVFTIGGNGESLLYLGTYALTKDDYYLIEGEKTSGSKGLTDIFKARGWDGLTAIGETLDDLNTGYSIVNDVKGFLNNPSSMIDDGFGFKDKLKIIEKSDMTEALQNSGWRHYQNLYKHLGLSLIHI